MKAIIMAGGEGTRLRPLTCDIPKPMVPIMNKPIMEHIIDLLKKHGIFEIGVTLGYLPDKIKNYFGDGSAFGVQIEYFTEDTPLGTAGSVKAAEHFINGDFLVISGDCLTDINLKEAINFHTSKKAVATIVLTKVDVPLDYGVVITTPDGKIERFLEKPQWSDCFSDTVNTGIYVLNPSVLQKIPPNTKFDFSKDVFPVLLAENQPVYGFVSNGYWCDIGDLNVYRHCHYDVFDNKVKLNISAKEISPGVWAENNAVIESGAVIIPPVLLCENSRVKSGASVESYTVLGTGSLVESNTSLKRTVIWSNCRIYPHAQLRGAIICDNVKIKERASVYEQSVIGTASVIEENAIVKPAIKIWPYKTVEAGSVVNSNLIWGTKHTHSIFGNKGIVGEVNVDITPEFASRLGTSFGSFFKGNAKLSISSDGSNAAQMFKASLMAGMLSTGVEVFDMGEQPLPISRSGIPFYSLDGGIHVAVSDVGGRPRAFIDFLDKHGANLNRKSEQNLEGIFMREEFIRCEPENIREVSEVYEYKLYYLREIISSVKNKNMQFKILASTSTVWGQRLLSSAALDLKCIAEIRTDKIDISNSELVSSFAKDVVQGGYDIGAILDHSCEKLTLIEEKGNVISDDIYKVLVALIIMKKYSGACIAAEVSAPAVIDYLASKYGAVVKRTKNSPLELMDMLTKNNQKEASEQFILHFDAVGALIKIMDFLAENKQKLSELIAEIPHFYVLKGETPISTENKAKLIRSLIEQNENKEIELTDGIKINEKGGWVLVLPDNSRPICHIVSEGNNEEYAKELFDDIMEKIRNFTE